MRERGREREVKIVIIGVIGVGKIFGNGHGIFQKRHGVTR
jgi:signal recognition particle receptor subunit beta